MMESRTKITRNWMRVIILSAAAVLILAVTAGIVFLGGGDEPAAQLTADGDTAESTADNDAENGDEETDGADTKDPPADDPDETTVAGDEQAPECGMEVSQLETIEQFMIYLNCADADQADREDAWQTYLSTFSSAQEACWDADVQTPFTLNDLESALGTRVSIENIAAVADSIRSERESDKAAQILTEKMLAYADDSGLGFCVRDFLNLLELPELRRNNRDLQRRNDIGSLKTQTYTWSSNQNGRLPQNADDWKDVFDSVDWSAYNGDASQPALSIAAPTEPSGQFKVHVITDADQVTQADLNAIITDFYLPGHQEVHIWLGAQCQDEVLASGNDKDVTTSADNRYTNDDMLLASQRVTAFVYQLEGEEGARCEDNT